MYPRWYICRLQPARHMQLAGNAPRLEHLGQAAVGKAGVRMGIVYHHCECTVGTVGHIVEVAGEQYRGKRRLAGRMLLSIVALWVGPRPLSRGGRHSSD
jgi:hypothetical protein